MSAQLKLIIDKCYCRGLQLKNKKVGTIVVGGSPVGSIQYELIDKQFDCMAKYLSWDMLFKTSYYATARDELEKNKEIAKEITKEVKRGVTGLYGKGMFKEQDKLVLICAVSRGDISKIKDIAKKIDEKSFIIIANAREVLGKGFKEG